MWELKDESGNVIVGMKVFLKNCVTILYRFRDDLIERLEHPNFETRLCSKFTAERFINDLNLAMTCSLSS